jgi:MATE family multidrug resistance protein
LILNKKILHLAIPNIISNITVPLLGLVDMALMGHIGDERYIGAIAIGGLIFNFIYWSLAFLRMGTSGFTAQAFGENDKQKAITILFRGLLVAFVAAFFIIALQVPIEWLSFKMIHGSAKVESLAREYFLIRIWAAPATLAIYVLNGWFLGMQNSKITMFIAIAINLANIAFNCLFIFGFGMKSAGVAFGTVIAQYTGLILAFVLLNRKFKGLFHLLRREALFNVREMLHFFKVNSNIFFRTLCVIIVFTFFTSRSAATNDTVLAVNSLLLQFLMLFAHFIDGFAFAGEALVGNYVGAKRPDQFFKVVRLLFLWGIILAVAYSLMYWLGGNFILTLLTNNSTIIAASSPFMIYVILVPLFSMASFVWDGIYIGATATRGMLLSMLGATFLIFFPLYFGLKAPLGNHALWVAMLGFMGGRGMFQTLMARRFVYTRIKK